MNSILFFRAVATPLRRFPKQNTGFAFLGYYRMESFDRCPSQAAKKHALPLLLPSLGLFFCFLCGLPIDFSVSNGKLSGGKRVRIANPCISAKILRALLIERESLSSCRYICPCGEKKSFYLQDQGKDDVRHFLEALVLWRANMTVVSEMGGNMIVNVKDTYRGISSDGRAVS